MKKYLHLFKMSLSEELQYRTELVLGRLKNVMILLVIFFVFLRLAEASGRFAGYTTEEIMTYIFGVNILRGIVFGSQSRQMAQEINSGFFSKYLVQPVNHFWFQFWSEAGQRIVNLFSAILEVVIFAFLLQLDFIWQTDPTTLALFVLSIVLAMFLYFCLAYLVNMLAFWSREAMGPRFLFEWILEFSSGSYFPLDILKSGVYSLLGRLPFFYLIFFPISIYLGRFTGEMIWRGIFLQGLWIGIAGMLCWIIWDAGVKRYSGEGI